MTAHTTEPRLEFVQCLDSLGLHKMAYWEWGVKDNPAVLICVHGVSRQGRDFDVLARLLSQHYRVICPDIVGRGQSDWLMDPMDYQISTYVADIVTLIARLGVSHVDWIGTSMGGLIGMHLAALHNTPIRKLVLNDIGPRIELAALERIGSDLGLPLRFQDLDEAVDFFSTSSAGFGKFTHEQWSELTRPMVKPLLDGPGLELHYDPSIAIPYKIIASHLRQSYEALEAAQWQRYDAIKCSTLLLRGADSDLLTREAAEEMVKRGPKARLHEFAGVGHAPMFLADNQIAVVQEFLYGP